MYFFNGSPFEIQFQIQFETSLYLFGSRSSLLEWCQLCCQTNPGSNTELTFYCSIWFLVYKMQTKKPKSSLPKLVTIGDNTYKEPRTSNKTTKLEPNHLRKARIYLFPILDSKEIKPINPKGNQPCIFTRRTDAENEAPVLWPPHAKSWLIEKGLDAGKDWRQKEKGATEDEMVG